MKRSFLGVAASLAIISGVAFWFLTLPRSLPPAVLGETVGSAARGERIFNLSGCATCHAAPKAEGAELLLLSGGRKFPTPFGTFIAPNISPDPVAGIGNWRDIDLVNAMRFGTSPDGRHYYPAFPYTSYSRMTLGDIVDLKAYLDTLPPVATASLDNAIGFPFNIRRGLGLWKRLYLKPGWVVAAENLSPLALRGRELVEGAGRCAACHSPRGPLGNILTDNWLGGAPNPTGRGRIPSLRPGKGGLNWSAADIALYFKSGLTPEYDTASGTMVEVIESLAKLPDGDREAIAAYLKALPPL